MSVENDGGPAFPQSQRPEERGMSLRDIFAAAALKGLAANHEMLLSNHDLVAELGTLGIDKLQANKAYRLADAMLEARNK